MGCRRDVEGCYSNQKRLGERGSRRCPIFWLRSSKGVAFKEDFLWEEERRGNDPNPLLRKRVRPDRIDLGLYLGVLGIA